MKYFVSLLAVLFFSSIALSDDNPPRYYLIHKNAFGMVPKSVSRPSQQDNEHYLAQLSNEELMHLVRSIHDRKFTCSGFYDVQEEASQPNFNVRRFLQPTTRNKQQKFSLNKSMMNINPLVGRLVASTQKDRYYSYIKTMTQFPDRSARSKNGVAASDWFVTKTQSISSQLHRPIEVMKIPSGRFFPQNSIVIKVTGSQPTLPGVLIGGHIDTFGTNKPGADDDASGAAAVLEVLTTVLSSPVRFQRNMYFAFYAAEEVGLVGSKKVVDYFDQQKIPIQAALQLDMVGYRSPNLKEKLFMVTDYTDPQLTSYVKQLAISYLKLDPKDIGETQCSYACSDHANWNRYKVPVAYPLETDFQNANKLIHTAKDDMSVIDLDHAYRFVQLAAAFVSDLAGISEIK